jgi:hypothetical protein
MVVRLVSIDVKNRLKVRADIKESLEDAVL